MKHVYKLAACTLTIALLNGCHVMDWSSNGPNYGDDYYNSQSNYPLSARDGNSGGPRYGRPGYTESSSIAYKPNPDRFANLDSDWVNKQSPGSYTIELANSEKRTDVAKQLTDTPKLARTAQVKYQENGTTRYRGVYGTYPTRQAAEAALAKLPANVRQNASIHKWETVQGQHQSGSNVN